MKEKIKSGIEFPEKKQELFKRKIEKYYSSVDAGDFESVYELFADDIKYERAGRPTIEGIDELRKFYEEDREMIEPKHSIDSNIAEGDEIAVRGVVSFTKENGEERNISFSDFFIFNEDGKIGERKTYLAEENLDKKGLEEADYSPESTVVEGDKKAVRGIVNFKGEDGQKQSIGFSDFSTFDESGQTTESKIYLLKGYESIE